ncbi:MAG: tetratricopeptide repeat protein [Calothrix sp. MO_167.B12]|nr:tetratricopeptide repeat protein [Calothrix sp. MO_167.B12]
MNEKRQQAYLNLIQSLLDCSSNHESQEILTANQELLDAGFLQVLEAVAQTFSHQGDENTANWLRNLAMQLGRGLNRDTEVDLQSLRKEEIQTYFQFLMQVLQATASSSGDAQLIYPLLAQNTDKLDGVFAKILRRWGKQTLVEAKPGEAESIAGHIAVFSNFIQQFPLGNKASNMEIAITGCEVILTIFTQDAFPELWAIIQINLGNAYRHRIKGDKAENIEKAIASSEAALEVSTRSDFPQDWAGTQYNLGLAYRERIKGNKAENIEKAIAFYQAALEVRTRNDFPQDWAMTQNNLGNAYRERIKGNKAENIEKAIASYEATLEVYTRNDFPQDWAQTLSNLGNTYRERIKGNKAENIEKAIASYEAALEVRTRNDFPQDWAGTQNNLGLAYCDRIKGDKAENIEKAIASYEAALEVRTRNDFPQYWATTQTGLGNAYSKRIKGDKAENIEKAIASYEAALEVRTRNDFPQDWATTQNNLGIAYSDRIKGDKAENIEKAIASYEAALEVSTRNDFPQDWATTQNNLGLAYHNRIWGERAENLELAIATCKEALTVYTREGFPQHWAQTQNNLANAYGDRIRGERAENLELAIATCKEALTVYTREGFPQHWAQTQNNLASAYLYRIRGERAENLELAIAAYNQALTVYTRSAFLQNWAMTQNNLANAYGARIRGEKAENLELAIAASEAALTVYTREAFPQNWAGIQNNLAIGYYQRIRGEKAENLELAIAAYNAALTVRTREAFPQDWALTQNNLANAYGDRIRGERAENLELAIAASEAALTVLTREAFPQDWAGTQHNLANAYRKRIRGERIENLELAIATYKLALQVYTHEAFPKECRNTARNLGGLHFEQQAWAKAANKYTLALEAGEILYQSAILLDGKAAELAAVKDLPRRAAYALARTGKLEQAALTIEQSRARGLSESLNRDRANLTQLQQLAPNLYTEYADITTQIRNLETQQRLWITSDDRHSLTPEALRNEAHRLHQKLMETIKKIRHVPGYEGFLAQPSFDDIRQAIRPYIPLIYLVYTPAGSLALILTQDGITDLRLDDFTPTRLIEILNNWSNTYNQSQVNHSAWLDAIEQGTRQLWQPLMAPLINYLQQHNFQQATLIPTEFLSSLPLHTAWTEAPNSVTGRHYAFDDIHFTYAPNARSLVQAQDIAQRTRADSILAIDNPRKDLPNSTREVTAAIATFPEEQKQKVLQHEQAAIEAVLAALPHYNVLHFSCHGTANLQDPLTSGLLMSDGLLTLRDLLNLNLDGIRLAVLSACETGLSGIELADEAISLPTGLLQAGVAGVVASLWSVSDLSTMMLLTRFYDLWRVEGLEIDQALRQAQQWVRDSTNGEKVDYFKASLPEFANVKMPGEVANVLYQSFALSNPNARDFAHPFHWAAFQYVGV